MAGAGSSSSGSGSSFPTLSEFGRIADGQREVYKEATRWDELGEGVVFRINSIEKKDSKFGVCHLLHCTKEGEEESGEEIYIFAPKALIKDFKKRYRVEHVPYFISLGQGVCELTKNKRNNFDLIFVEEWGCPEITLEE